MTDNYYKLPYVSNSDLGELKLALRGQERDIDALRKHFEFGNLIDAMITEESKIGYFDYTLREESSEKILQFTEELFKKAVNIKECSLNHSLLNLLLRNMEFQKVITEQNFEIEQGFEKFTLPAKCKFDGVNQSISTGLDLKTTGCRKLKQFVASIEYFDYDRQAAWYMDLAGTNRHWIIGITKEKPHQIFEYAIKRGDEVYNRGKEKYQFLAYQFSILIQNFQTA